MKIERVTVIHARKYFVLTQRQFQRKMAGNSPKTNFFVRSGIFF